jgi:hypothetical protein
MNRPGMHPPWRNGRGMFPVRANPVRNLLR